MTDFLIQSDEDGVTFQANSHAARQWCVDNLQQMADPIFRVALAPAIKVLFERQGFTVVDRRHNVTPIGKRGRLDELK